MKRTALVFLLLLPLVIAAQPFNGGVLAGGNISQVDGDDYAGYTKFGFQAGGFVSLRLSPHSSFQMEMEYIQKGSRINADSLNQGNTYLMRFNYLEIPVLYQYSFTRTKRLSVEAGPAADVTLGSYEESNGQETASTVPLRRVTLTGILGFSGFITDHMKINFRFNYSLLSIRVTPPPDGMPYPASYRYILFEKGQYNNVLSLSLAWYFKNSEQ